MMMMRSAIAQSCSRLTLGLMREWSSRAAAAHEPIASGTPAARAGVGAAVRSHSALYHATPSTSRIAAAAVPAAGGRGPRPGAEGGQAGAPEARWLGVLALAAGLALGASRALSGGSTVAFAAGTDERSFIMIKPDGVARGLVSAIIGRFEARGYKLVGLKMLTPSVELAERHYAEHAGKPFFPKLTSFLSSGPVVAMVFEGKGVVQTGRQMIGATNPAAASPGTIRGDYGIDLGRNIVHGSDSHESAFLEISLWFSPSELNEYAKPEAGWLYE